MADDAVLPFGHGLDLDAVRARAMQAVDDAIAAGGDPLDPSFAESLRLPDDGSRDFAILDPAQCKLKRGRIRLPGVGWVRVDDARQPPRGARLTKVELRRTPDGFDIIIEADSDQFRVPASRAAVAR